LLLLLSQFGLDVSQLLLQSSFLVSRFQSPRPYHRVLQFLQYVPTLFPLIHRLISRRNRIPPMGRLLLSYSFPLVKTAVCYELFVLRNPSVRQSLHLEHLYEGIVCVPSSQRSLRLVYVSRCYMGLVPSSSIPTFVNGWVTRVTSDFSDQRFSSFVPTFFGLLASSQLP